MEEKLQHARQYEQRDMILWTVAVDKIDGGLHQTLDPKPNAAYLIGSDGRVFARVLWSNDGSSLRQALQAIVQGQPLDDPERTSKSIPMFRAIGTMDDVLGASGSQARRDFRHALPPVYAIARLASLYRPLPPPARGIAVAATVALAVGLIGIASWSLWHKPRND